IAHERRLHHPTPVQDLPSGKEFSLSDSSGNRVKFASFKGGVVFLHFWAAWCPPCLDEIRHLIAFAKKHRDKPMKVIAISLDPSWEEAQKVLDAKDLPSNMISLLDPKQEVSNLYGSFEYPETYFIDKEQKIVHKWIGPQNWE